MKTSVKTSISRVAALIASLFVFSAFAELSDYTKYSYSSGDSKLVLKLDRFQYDYNQSTEPSGEIDEDVWLQRRFRFSAQYQYNNWELKWVPDASAFKGSEEFESEFNDLYIRYKGKKWQVTLGNQKVPIGLEELTSSKDIRLLERSAITEQYAFGRETSANFAYFGKDYTYQFSVFEDADTNGNFTHSSVDRVTWAAINESDSVLHLGLSIVNIIKGEQGRTGLELAYLAPGFHLQVESMQDDSNDGQYIALGWVVTGEMLKYSKGKLKAFKPKNPSGAWELVYRYEDGYGNFADIELSRTNLTAQGVGVNYYLDKYWRFSLNYTEGTNQDAETGSELRFRAQLRI